MRLIVFNLFFFSVFCFSQITDLKQIPTKYKDVKESAVVAISDQELLLFFVNSAGDSIFSIRTTNSGNTWQPESFVQKTKRTDTQESFHLGTIKASNNRIILTWAIFRDSITVLRSDDRGNSWLPPIKFRAVNKSGPSFFWSSRTLNLSKSPNGILFLNFTNPSSFCWFKKSIDNGDTWSDSAFTILSQYSDFSSLIPIDDLRFIAFINKGGTKIISLNSTDGGYTWSSPSTVFESPVFLKYSKAILTNDNKIWLAYQKETSIPYSYSLWTSQQFYKTSDIYYRISEDFGITWQPEKQLTKYIGDDNYINLSNYNNSMPLFSFSTQRFTNNYNLTFLIPGKYEEIKTPPYIIYSLGLDNDTIKNKCMVKANVIDDESVSKVLIDFANGKLKGELFDDGNHNDGAAGDSVYANVFDTPTLDNYDVYLLENNNLKMPINKDGMIAITKYPVGSNTISGTIEASDNSNNVITKEDGINLTVGKSGGRFDDVVFLFSSGFMMSGLDGDSIWSNGVASVSLVEDYVPGNVGSDPNDKRNSIYVLKAEDKPFGNSWQVWKDAVERGAEFYDGDKDGIYNPIDKNFNGIWDPDEDMPMILGEETVWCVYNDAVPASLRRWGIPPKNIEVAQTIFTSNKPGLENVMFVRYKLLNKSLIDYDSVYFGFWADPDLGDASDDKVGCDTLLNSGIVYNDEEDWYYGNNPPSFFTTLLQGPVLETGLTTDTAYNKLGELLGSKQIPFYINQDIYAHQFYIGGDPTHNDPGKAIDARNYLQGKNKFGEYDDPCNLLYGRVLGGVNCNEINKRYLFSGDPVTQVGWIETTNADQRNLLSTGPFKLKSNEPVDIISAYVVVRGTDAINSITVTREIVRGVIEEYKNNFPRLTYKPGAPTNPVVSYELYQNYPNPFNPATTIRYAIPEDGIVTIKVFDILGQQVTTLKNEFQKANRYEVQFSSKGLASGVYIYKFQVNDHTQSRKMMVLK